MIKPTYQNTFAPVTPDRRPAAPTRDLSEGPATASSAPAAAPLSGEEQRMIDSQFPASRRMELRLYGPARPAEQLAKGLGLRLDIKG